MFRTITLLCLMITLSGCSFLPHVSFAKQGTTPTSTEKSSLKESCKGDFKTDPEGNITSCTKGYYRTAQNYTQQERKFTLQERAANFVRGLAGWGFILLIAGLFFCPGLIGWIVSRLFDGVKRVAQNGLKLTSKAIKDWKDELPDDLTPEAKKVVDDLFDKLEEAHSIDPALIKMIGDIRTQLKIEDNDK